MATSKARKRRKKEQRARKRKKANLDRLAECLIARHIRIAVPSRRVRDRLVAKGKAQYDVNLVEREMRCIAVVGAGGSAVVLKRSDELADELEAQFERDDAELERLRLVNNLDEITFETRLVALSKSPPAEREVRDRISEMYRIRYPSLLGYELLAHLLKHRFLDAIITFNFDELLDQSLDDELDEHEYIRIISERDCTDVVSDPGLPNYVPLYVKLHGTASEPDSLRYTPQSYYALPPRILAVVRNLLRSEHCVVANIGSNLGSFDFQRLLRIPERLEVFNLSVDRVPKSVAKKIASEREHCDGGPWLFDCNSWCEDSNALMSRLTSVIEEKTGESSDGLVEFRSVQRHKTLAHLLGPDTIHRCWLDDDEWAEREWTEYCRRRTILELAFAGAKARGLMSLVPLTTDRPARYFDRYRQRTNGQGDNWRTFCSAAGLMESEETPDILYTRKHLRRRVAPNGTRPDRHLNEVASERLARHVLTRIKNPFDDDDVAILKQTIKGLQTTSDVEFHMRDDRVCSKAFKRPVTLPTATSLRAYTWLMLQNVHPEDRIHISTETGAWLLDKRAQELLSRQKHIRALLAFDIDAKKLKQAYGRRLEIAVTDPWRHNRHMTIVCKRERPTRAIYFARRLRAPVITAVYLRSTRDGDRLLRLYNERWDEI